MGDMPKNIVFQACLKSFDVSDRAASGNTLTTYQTVKHSNHLKPPSLQVLNIDILQFATLKYYDTLGPGLRRGSPPQPATGQQTSGPRNPHIHEIS
jgi:hypothetical protein